MGVNSFLRQRAVLLCRRHQKAALFVKSFAQDVSPETVAVLDYPIILDQQWKTYNPYLYETINERRDFYEAELKSFLPLQPYFLNIPARCSSESNQPSWINGWMPALDGIALYAFMVANKPALFLEVGSGNSTKFARKAITDHKLDTKIISIDPRPRAEIDALCDEVIRKPVECVDLAIFDRLIQGDILYIDNSHRVFMNSDAVVTFLDVLPRLKRGVLMEIHDICLPYDYPREWIGRYYSEQYLLAAYLLAKGNKIEIVLPSTFISRDRELHSILRPLWSRLDREVETHGCSFWLRTK